MTIKEYVDSILRVPVTRVGNKFIVEAIEIVIDTKNHKFYATLADLTHQTLRYLETAKRTAKIIGLNRMNSKERTEIFKEEGPYPDNITYIVKAAEPTLDWENVYHFKVFVIDRYRVHKRKDIQGLPAPWTKNPILQEFKFTNVRREHDKQTRYLLEHVTNNPELTLEDKIANSFIFRAWNNLETFRDFGFPYPVKKLYSPKLKEKVRPLFHSLQNQQKDRLWFTNAFHLSGPKDMWGFVSADPSCMEREPEVPLRPFNIGVYLKELDIVNRLLNAKDQLEAFEIIKSLRGFADFLAYQIFVDLTYIKEFPFSENEFTVAGPGCKKGLNYIFIDKAGMSYEECLFWLRDNINYGCQLFYKDELYEVEELKGYPHREYNPEKLFSDLPKDERCMNVMSIENCMCELGKYLPILHGKRKKIRRYNGNGGCNYGI